MKRDSSLKGHLLALFSVLVWGTTFIATKILLEAFEPVDILFYRFLIGYIMLWILYPHTFKAESKKDEFLLFLSGASGVTIYFLCENFALTYTYASNVSILVATAPFVTGLLARIFLKEPLKRSFVIGFLLSIVGIVLITTNGSIMLHLNPLGDLLAIGASICWAVYSLTTVMVSGSCGDLGLFLFHSGRKIDCHFSLRLWFNFYRFTVIRAEIICIICFFLALTAIVLYICYRFSMFRHRLFHLLF